MLNRVMRRAKRRTVRTLRAYRRWRDRAELTRWSETVMPFDWSAYPYNRVAVINKLASLVGASSYLEIGCANNESFHGVVCPEKVGVDPVSGGTHRMTSDGFFRQNDRSFDLVFIDGLHEASQVMRDVENSLRALNQGGVIALHDCLPKTYAMQAMPRQQETWTGDVWKAVVELKRRPDLDVRVVFVDHGCGVVLPRARTDDPDFPQASISELDFAYFTENWEKLGIIRFEDLEGWVKK